MCMVLELSTNYVGCIISYNLTFSCSLQTACLLRLDSLVICVHTMIQRIISFLNFALSDKVFFLGRAGYAVTLTLAMPLVLLPCREALLSLPEQWSHRKAASKVQAVEDGPLIINGVNFDEELPLLSKAIKDYDSAEKSSSPEARAVELSPPTFTEYAVHIGSTALIVTICYTGAVAVPGVAVVWSICGSSMAISKYCRRGLKLKLEWITIL